MLGVRFACKGASVGRRALADELCLQVFLYPVLEAVWPAANNC
jgi:hypothetical protein